MPHFSEWCSDGNEVDGVSWLFNVHDKCILEGCCYADNSEEFKID